MWETTRVFISGKQIAYKAYQRKSRREKLEKLSQRVDSQYAKLTDNSKERMTLQGEWDFIVSQHITKLLIYSRFTFYEEANKVHQTHWVHQISASHLIPQIKTGLGITSYPLEIKTTILWYSIHFYICLIPLQSLSPFLIGSQLPS